MAKDRSACRGAAKPTDPLPILSTVTRFQNVLSDIDVECQSIREQAELYSDGEDLTDADLTQAIALHNSLISIRKLFEAINAKPVNRKS